ncbi:unnamed protein product [Closterium sp. Naga37s-1]|nr:unnamed protein product [Closterium sp. Naga37s-1]
MFKKSSKPKNVRKRQLLSEDQDRDSSSSGGGDEDASAGGNGPPKSKSARRAEGKLAFSSASSQQRAARAAAAEAGADGALEGPAKPAVSFAYESDRRVQVKGVPRDALVLSFSSLPFPLIFPLLPLQMASDSRATATIETETEFDRDSRAIREKVLKQAEEALKGRAREGGSAAAGPAGPPGSKKEVYKGMAGYADHTAGFRREHTVASEKATGAHGPLRASTHIRWSVRFDYQPDLCKDYKETGYCGYGDSCKFLHDRGDYKAGWQIEREWQEKEKRRKEAAALGMLEEGDGGEGEEEEDDDDDLPFACFICRQSFVDPVVTKCRHYFCEHCALKHHSRNKNCFVCEQPTQGVFNTAHDIIKRVKERAAKEAKDKEEVAKGAGSSRPEAAGGDENLQAEEPQAEGLRQYEDEARRFSIRVPAAWEQRDKAGATALFANPERRGDTLGVVVNPVRVRSLRDFGDIDYVATRLLDAERRKESTKSAEILSQRVKELAGGIPLYQIEYALASTRGSKRILTAVTIADRKLYIVNIAVADSESEPVDLATLGMLRRALDSFALLS